MYATKGHISKERWESQAGKIVHVYYMLRVYVHILLSGENHNI